MNKALINDPTAIFVYLIALVGFVFFIADKKYIKRIFNILPFVFWIYFLPMLSTTLGITPNTSPLYGWTSKYILSTCLILLFLSVNIPAIMKLGFKAIILMLSGSFGIFIGAPIAYFILKSHLPPEAWSGIGALAGSWIGGSANMLAIKESFNTPLQVFTPVTIVDIVVGYGWMAIVVGISVFQQQFDKWNKADTKILNEVNTRMKEIEESRSKPTTTSHLLMMLGLAFLIGFLSLKAGYYIADYIKEYIPQAAAVFSGKTVMVILVTIIGIGLSFTKVSRLEDYGSSKVGYVLLYFLLATIGVQADLKQIAEAPMYIALGVIWLSIHALCLFIALKIFRAPIFFAATASQANIGGAVSAPVVAAVYQPSLAVVGLLMGIIGSIIGTFLGLGVGITCKIIAGV